MKYLCLMMPIGYLLCCSLATAEQLAISPREFELYMDWKQGREDSRLVEFAERLKMKKIARSLGISFKEMQAIVTKVDPVIISLKGVTEKTIRQNTRHTPIKDKIQSVEVNLETNHAIAWIKWRCGDTRDVEKEAAYVAWSVAQGGSVIKTLGLWCVTENNTKLFSAKIGRNAFLRINGQAIERFAQSRYIKLFEEVKIGPHP